MPLQLFHPAYDVEACTAAVRDVLQSGWTGTGPKCAEFEKAWSEYTGAKHSLFLNSATAALHVALRLADLPKGSKVATTPITFVSTNAVILYEGHVPHFCDVDPGTMAMDWVDVIEAVTKHGCRAVMWVHYGGSVDPDFYEFMEYRAKHFPHVPVIEDCAHASGARYLDGSRVGSRVDTLSCFSFQAVKNLPTFDSGMLCGASEVALERARRLSWLGISKSTYDRTQGTPGTYAWAYTVPELGWKYNGNDVAAAIGLVQLNRLDAENQYRRELHDYYLRAFHGVVGLAEVLHDAGSSHHIFAVQIEDGKRERVIAALKEKGIAPGVHYLPNFEFPVFAPFYRQGQCPEAEKAGGELLSLPNHLRMGAPQIDEIAHIVKGALK